jgi:Flp pilus assembly protein TadG
MLRLLKRNKKDGEKGQALAEFALVVPILLILLVGIVEIGYGLNSYLTVVDSARDGARLGSKGSASDDEIKALVQRETERLPDGVALGDITVTRDSVPGSSSVAVEVCYDHSLIMGVPAIIPDPLHMCSTTTMPTIDGN